MADPLERLQAPLASLAQPKGLKPGTNKVVVFLGDDSVDAKVLAVKK